MTKLFFYLTIYNFHSIIDSRLGFKEASEYNKIFKKKPSWSISSWLLQRVAFLVLN